MDFLKKIFKKKEQLNKTIKAQPPKDSAEAKKIANKNKEPFIEVVGLDIDAENPVQGAFELDWNDIFVAKLVRAGYQGKTDNDIVDNWFQDVCRNIVLESYEKEQAQGNVENLDEHRKIYK